MTWAIKASMRVDDYKEDTIEEYVARFSSRKNAEQYLEASKLKKPRWSHKYRYASLLCAYDDAWIEKFNPPESPLLDPEITWKRK